MKLLSVILTVLYIFILGCKTSSAGGNETEPDINKFTAEIAVSWNEQVIRMAVTEDGLLTLKGVRTLSMMHIAIHDALNTIHPVHTGYAIQPGRPLTSISRREAKDADPIASAAQAAYTVAVDQFPDQRECLEEELNKWLKIVDEGRAKIKGIQLGKASALKILQQRENDDWNSETEYTFYPMAPGVYAEFNEHSNTPEGFVFGAGWAKTEPFMLTSQDQFRSPPPPEINSDAYTKAFNEVKEVGRFESESRTDDQSHLAMWWKDFVENSHNRLARKLVIKEKLNLWDASRLFALLNMGVYDAYVSVFENKFHYNHWRPYTAIRWAANDGNPVTVPDTTWNNLHKHTYAFPSYPSAHGTASAAAMTVLADVFGDNYSFTMMTRKVDKAGPFSGKVKIKPSIRSFDSFSEAAMECSMSRVYLGIHFRYDSVEGNKLGKKIGNYALENFLQPLK